jgi:hypothetical protein
VWRVPGAVHQSNIAINGGRLRAKLLVFSTQEQMRRFWWRNTGRRLAGNFHGAVNDLARRTEEVLTGRQWLNVDARYFCVVGLLRRHLTMQVISHECVHAAFAFARRRARTPWDALAVQNDEEAIAYPVGRIAREIVIHLDRAGLMDR